MVFGIVLEDFEVFGFVLEAFDARRLATSDYTLSKIPRWFSISRLQRERVRRNGKRPRET